MNDTPRFLLACTTLGAALAAARLAAAQADVNPPLPNVLLLVDTSGSMEYESGSTDYPDCSPDGNGPNERSRWIELVEVLTGSIADYRCQKMNRRDAGFRTEYGLAGRDPYDVITETPYHRPLSGTCTPGPGNLPPVENAYAWPDEAIRPHRYYDRSADCSWEGAQAQDGLLDVFRDQVRFGLMTFDTEPSPETGVSNLTANYALGMQGTWSYFLESAHRGAPTGCATLADMEVGARNAAAPPWEGRMVAFGDPTEEPVIRNSWIQQILLSTRPFGATPIAGMLDDARDFLWNDTSPDPLDPSRPFGPSTDPYMNDGCRLNTIILLSDGEPNLDLRPDCELDGSPEGVCPYDQTPEQVAFDLANAADPNKRTQTFVIAFALPTVEVNGVPVLCKDLTDTDLTGTGGRCAMHPDNQQLQACCTLNRIAFNGSTERAFFPTNMDELRSALSEVLSEILGSASSRTLPVFSNASGSGSAAAAYRFYSSFSARSFYLWQGILERQRYRCLPVDGEMVAVPQDISRNDGDDFIYNVNANPAGRKFYSVQGADVGGAIHSEHSVRPADSIADGVGSYSGTQYYGEAEAFVTATSPAAMGITDANCADGDATYCRNLYLRWVVGLDNNSPFHRCEVPGAADCNLVGDIFHSTPAIVDRPSGRIRDESYARFAAEQAERPLVLYTSTNDGFLHAFKVEVTQPINNELWAFAPPAVLPALRSQYPGAHQLLLDGAPVVQDVPAIEVNGAYRFERSADAARAGSTTWRTVLLQAFGGARGGYFAVDVTEPDPAAGGGPRFLWQLTKTSSGQPIFGLRGGNPIITTLFFDTSSLSGGSAGAREVAVAILPGGIGGVPNGDVQRAQADHPGIDPLGTPRPRINAYPTDGIGARSLTIVRLDTGEIVRTFRQSTADAPSGLPTNRIIISPIDSPITGTPAAFPASLGAIADRVYVGDSDGVLWRADLSSTNPDDWEMRMFLDSYRNQAPDAGQPIMTQPVVSVDDQGEVVVVFSTGDQEVFSAPAEMKNYIWSLTETVDPNDGSVQSKVNWYSELVGGERVAGPINLFMGSLFFSTFQPEPDTSSSVCATGNSRIWGMHYAEPAVAEDLSQGGQHRLPNPDQQGDFIQVLDNTHALLDDNATIFGVGVTQVPTCSNESEVADDFIGAGAMHTTATSVTPGAFQLVMHTGSAGTATAGGQARVQTIDLPTPHAYPRIDSWAAIVE
jgi:type IV pilus assembly protein PilY1